MEKTVSLFIGDLAIGGAQRVVVNLSKGLSNSGYDIEIVLVKKRGELLSQIPDSVELVELSTDRMRWCAIPFAKYLYSTKPDAVISFLTGANIMSIIGNTLVGKPTQIIVTEHSIKSAKNRKSVKRELLLARYLYKYADGIIGVSNGVIRDIHNWTGIPLSELTVIYNPVVESPITQKDYEPPDHPWYTNSDIPIIVSVGRHTKDKDYSTLIRAFAEVTSDRDARLVLVGDGELTTEYRKLADELGIKDYLYLPGFELNPYPYLLHSDVFVLSSSVEGLSNALIEAMNCGTPVVSTDCPAGPSEILNNGEFGSLVPVGDEVAMASAILETIEDPLPPDALRDRASKFSVSNAVDEYINIIQEVEK